MKPEHPLATKQPAIIELIHHEGYIALKQYLLSRMAEYNPLHSIEDIGKMALIDKGIKDVFDQAESIARANFEAPAQDTTVDALEYETLED